MCWKFELCLPLRTLFHDAMWTKMIKGKKNVYLNMIVCLDKYSLIQYLLLLQTQTLYDLFRPNADCQVIGEGRLNEMIPEAEQSRKLFTSNEETKCFS